MYDEKPLKRVIQEFVEAYKLKNKLNQVRLIESWGVVVGKMIAQHTKHLSVNKRILYAELDSSIVRNEVYILKSKIMTELNSKFDKPVIDDIVLK
ncbi:MAG: DUF721 domain-containing protein [Bacteroidota bacterium]